jgi:hypothetical protein
VEVWQSVCIVIEHEESCTCPQKCSASISIKDICRYSFSFCVENYKVTLHIPCGTTFIYFYYFSNTTYLDQTDHHQVFLLYKNLKLKLKMIKKTNYSRLVVYILYHLWDLAKIYIFTLSFKFLFKINTWGRWSAWSKYVAFEKIIINNRCVRRNT